MHRLVARVSFVTGWTRDYVLHSLTFKELIRYAEYAVEYLRESAKMQAMEIGLSLGFLRYPTTEKAVCTSINETVAEDDGGSMELLRRNLKWLKV